MDFNFAFTSLILLMNIEDILTLERLHVNCEHEYICAVRETDVTLRCFYKNEDIKTGFWFSHKQSQNWRESDEPEDIALDFDYSGRVKQQITIFHSVLTIRDVRERDSGEYQLMFIMKDGVKHISSVTVHLTVTVLQVKIDLALLRYQLVYLTCETSCSVTSGPRYFYWKKDGRYINLASIEPAAYSCDLTGDFKISSAPVCFSNSGCWNVTYTSRRVCALVGSTAEIHSSYSHPTGYTVVNTYWHSRPERFIDIREEQQFAGRVEYVGNTLRIKDVNMSDSGEYKFRIITNTLDGTLSGSPGVSLTVTDTKVTSSLDPVIEGQKGILSCSTKCTLDNNITFSWYKNGQPVTDGFKLLNKLYLNSVNKDELKEYSCTVTDVQSSEKRTRTQITIVMLSMLLILAVIGVLTYRFLRRRKHNSSQKRDNTKVEPHPSTSGNVAPQSTVSDFTHRTDSEEQDLHYSCVSFKQSDKSTSSTHTVIYSSAEDVHYATVKVK
ncbi:hypothetical protein IRJ41_019990 [Triplophysa rosa]|uniref:Ig-like domain-containing protein n=1 Tax=Triplophysa rosa TaxID=992332 RepID=A0A9W7WAB5_TRIRA|nr:hypothetical protein IRJ41_019990 [Triplophysa rosa]